MALDWIPWRIRTGNTTVKCKTCGEIAEFDAYTKIYECDCEFGATASALALGLEGYIESPSLEE